ncbi:MAG: CHAT domain-containing protein, partial [Cyanobacteria bacterium P01_D01_bin.44]
AQSVIPALDGTGTVVTQEGRRFDIGEGSLSADGDNLFHSFQNFQPNNGEIVNFLAEPSIQNIFTRIVSGNPAVIDGLLQISDSQANLFLLNPAGVILGPNARLNLPASLTLTTADGIGFEDGWFSAVGSNHYAALVGDPTAFAFTQAQPGVLLNEGALTLAPGQSLTLLGGTVINTGELSTPGGNITITAVPGEQIVRISQAGRLLDLEIAEHTSQPSTVGLNAPRFTPLMLPTLLTNGDMGHATRLVANADGTVSLTNSTLAIPTQPGTAIVAGAINVSNPRVSEAGVSNADVSNTGGNIAVLGNQVGILEAHLEASGLSGGGNILVGGDYQGQGLTPRATQTFIGEAVAIAADAQIEGNGGRIIVWADNTTQFWGQVSATGGLNSGAGGFVEISGKENLIFRGSVDVTAADGVSALGTLLLDPDNIQIIDGVMTGDDGELADNQILAGDGSGDFTLSEGVLENLLSSANVELQANDNIVVNDLSDNQLTFTPGPGSITWTADADQNGIGDITMLDTNDTISAVGHPVQFSGVNLRLGNVTTASETAGNLTLQANQTIDTGNLTTQSDAGTGGNVSITAGDSITTGNILTDGQASSGDVNITSTNATIATGDILTESTNGVSGNVSLSSANGTTTGLVTANQVNNDGISLDESDPLVDEFDDFDDDFESFDDDAEAFDEDFDGFENEFDEFDDDFEDADGDAVGFRDDAEDFEEDNDGFDDDDDDFDDDDDDFEEDDDDDDFEEDDDGFDDDDDGFDDDDFEEAPDQVFRTVLSGNNARNALRVVEIQRNQEFSTYFGRDLGATELTPPQIQRLLTQVYSQTGNQSVIVYVKAPKPVASPPEPTSSEQSASPLELMVFTASGDPVSLTIPDVSRAELFQTIGQFRSTLITSARRDSKSYLASAQQLYQWLIKPLEDELGPNAIDTVLFSMDSGLRSLPMAALHDGQQFLIEKYSVGMMPSLGLLDTQYQPLEDVQVLAMGASVFSALQPLPAVPTELEIISQLWSSQGFLNETFTRQNLIQQQQQTPFQIIHLATHAEFNPGNIDNSYIQLWNEQLNLRDIHTLGWDTPAVDLLVLSACRTAVGNTEAELGFAGLAVASGVKSAMASLWAVNDVGTLALMGEFYDQLRNTRGKSEALRAAQLAMIKGDTRIESGQLLSGRSPLPLPPELANLGDVDFSHPYYWSGFTLIGSPW